MTFLSLLSLMILISYNLTTFFGCPGPTHYRGFMMTLYYTHHTRYDFSGLVISRTQRPLPDNTQHSQEADIRALGGIRTRNPASEQLHTHALDRAASVIGALHLIYSRIVLVRV